jgi:hypothetical protein
VVVLGVQRQQDRGSPGRSLHDFPGGVQAVESRHGEVEHSGVGPKLAGKLHGLMAVRGLPHNRETRLLQERPQPLTDDNMIVCQQDFERHGRIGIVAETGSYRKQRPWEATTVSGRNGRGLRPRWSDSGGGSRVLERALGLTARWHGGCSLWG